MDMQGMEIIIGTVKVEQAGWASSCFVFSSISCIENKDAKLFENIFEVQAWI